MKIRSITRGFIWLAGIWLAGTTAAWPEINAGAGMEYYTAKIRIQDSAGRYFHTLLQSTLAITEWRFDQEPFRFSAWGGISDWNVSGEWQGSSLPVLTSEPFYWAWQQTWGIAADYMLMPNLSLGIRYGDHALRHYDGLTQHPYLNLRTQAIDACLGYVLLQLASVRVDVLAACSPWTRVTYGQDLSLASIDEATGEYSVQQFIFANTGVGTRWSGQLRAQYTDSAGWGLEIRYQASRAQFSPTEPLTSLVLTEGRLSGIFCIHF